MAEPSGPGPRDAGAALELRAAWKHLIAQLEAAREAIDDPKLHAPPASDRNLAEGYRYLLGYLYGAIGRALDDPLFPTFRRAIEPLDKATIDNADAVYLYAPIDGDQSYVVRARAGDARHWRGEPALRSGRKAPQYVIFETPAVTSETPGASPSSAPGRARTAASSTHPRSRSRRTAPSRSCSRRGGRRGTAEISFRRRHSGR
jgi:hypothetical protein